MTDFRRAALSLLLDGERRGTYANLALRDERLSSLSPKERALLTALFYGVTERRLTLDYYIGLLCKRQAADLTASTRALLRMGLYQILYMDGIPHHAAVNETVSLSRDTKERGFVNAVLRAALAEPSRLTPPDPSRDLVRHLSILYSMPRPLVKRFLSLLGEEGCRALLAAFTARPPLSLRVNTQKTTKEALLSHLVKDGYAAEEDPLSPFGIRLFGAAVPTALYGFEEGLFFVQDTASQLSSLALSPAPDSRVLDACACPGGKSFGAALLMGDRGTVEAFDIHESKLSLIEKGAARLGLSSVRTACHDATAPFSGEYDAVICDVPCSGLGVIAKKPDLRYREDAGTQELPALQASILSSAASALRVGGALVYSTCTLLPEENEAVFSAFLAGHPDYVAEDFTVGGLPSRGGMLTLYPHIHGTDGFFMAKMRRLAPKI